MSGATNSIGANMSLSTAIVGGLGMVGDGWMVVRPRKRVASQQKVFEEEGPWETCQGYTEKDEIRRHDSFQAFEETYSIAEQKKDLRRRLVWFLFFKAPHTYDEPAQHVEDDVANTLRILVATDCHLGYMEKDEIRRHDSFQAFEETYSIAEQ
ncbi:hypothetical protein NC653_004183 [Populus alba x Populus x berolinensis]|uniref:Uncharacterized protein n=1 Tax=Populus alba x Populus x berolinensis TaxID=444605 RepID=A0AAD6RVJ4_9ROSI|nr:hypothetical protein NC653_004183 [Populus alba x Populus x berolinensis]